MELSLFRTRAVNKCKCDECHKGQIQGVKGSKKPCFESQFRLTDSAAILNLRPSFCINSWDWVIWILMLSAFLAVRVAMWLHWLTSGKISKRKPWMAPLFSPSSCFQHRHSVSSLPQASYDIKGRNVNMEANAPRAAEGKMEKAIIGNGMAVLMNRAQ